MTIPHSVPSTESSDGGCPTQDTCSNNKIAGGLDTKASSEIPKQRYGKGIKHNVTVPSSIVGAPPRKPRVEPVSQLSEALEGNESVQKKAIRAAKQLESTAAVVELEEAATGASPPLPNTCPDVEGDFLPPILAPGRGGVTKPFPLILYDMLEKIVDDGMGSVVSWQPHGRCFLVHHPKLFVDVVMPKYFRQTKFASFQRQLNLYGFSRCTVGKDKGAYYHRLFLRGKRELCNRMMRIKIKGTKVRRAATPDREPNFYAMPPLDACMSTASALMAESDDNDDESRTMNDRVHISASTSSTVHDDGDKDKTHQRNAIPVSPVSSFKPVLCKTEDVMTTETLGEHATRETTTTTSCPSDVTLSSEASATSEDSGEADEYLDALLEHTGSSLPQQQHPGSIEVAMTNAVEPCQTTSASLPTHVQTPVVQAAVPTTVVAPQQAQQQPLQQQQHQFPAIQHVLVQHGITPTPGATTTYILLAPTSANGMMPAPTAMVPAPSPVVSQSFGAVGSVPAPMAPSMIVPTYCMSSGQQLETGSDVGFFEGKQFQCWE